MTAPAPKTSIRARGARRLTQLTAGMVVVGVGGVAVLAVHDAQHAHASTATSTTTGTSTGSASDASTSDTTSSSSVSSSSSTPVTTSGGS